MRRPLAAQEVNNKGRGRMTNGKHPNQRPPPNYSVRQVLERAESEQGPPGSEWSGQVLRLPDHGNSRVQDGRRPQGAASPGLSRLVMLGCAGIGVVAGGTIALWVIRTSPVQVAAKPEVGNVAQAQAVGQLAAASRPATSGSAVLQPSRMPTQPAAAEIVAAGQILTAGGSSGSIRLDAANIQIAAGAGEIPWPITIDADAKSIAGSKIRIRGLPHGARLSSGAVGSDGSWVVSATEGAALAITPPQGPVSSKLTVMVEAADGTKLASIDTMFEISPATLDTGPIAEPANAIGKNQSEEKARDLRLQGEERLAVGDVSSARMFFKRAADGGDAQAAVAMGATYDPRLFAALKVHGMSPDREIARKWYQRATDLGSKDAFERIEALK